MNYLFLADGFEEIEALTTVDVLRRAGMPVVTVSINPDLEVTGAHGVTVVADSLYEDNNDYAGAQWLILPGGVPGAPNLAAHEPLCRLLVDHAQRGGKVAAICASPAVVLVPLGLLDGRHAVCYPGMEIDVEGICWGDTFAAVDGNIVTGRGPAAAMDFALAIVGQTLGAEAVKPLADGLLHHS